MYRKDFTLSIRPTHAKWHATFSHWICALSLLLAGAAAAQAQQVDTNALDQELLTPFAPTVQEETLLGDGDFPEFTVEARLTEDGEAISDGLVWRVFAAAPGGDGTMPLLATAEGGTSRFQLAPGNYLVHAAFGRASVARKVIVTEGGGRESFTIEAGGLQLSANLAGARLESRDLAFEIYGDVKDERGERTLIAKNIAAGQIVRLNKGTYHIVSRYGDINAEVRADLRVQAGQVTAASVEQRGARIEVKLVTQRGGEALADTSWSIQTESGEEVFQSVNAQPDFILADGNYIAVAQNDGKVVTRDFSVKPGRDAVVELMAE